MNQPWRSIYLECVCVCISHAKYMCAKFMYRSLSKSINLTLNFQPFIYVIHGLWRGFIFFPLDFFPWKPLLSAQPLASQPQTLSSHMGNLISDCSYQSMLAMYFDQSVSQSISKLKEIHFWFSRLLLLNFLPCIPFSHYFTVTKYLSITWYSNPHHYQQCTHMTTFKNWAPELSMDLTEVTHTIADLGLKHLSLLKRYLLSSLNYSLNYFDIKLLLFHKSKMHGLLLYPLGWNIEWGLEHIVGLPEWLRHKESACNAGALGSIPGLGRSLEEGNGSSILPGDFPWTEEPNGLQSMGLQRVGHDWATNTFTFNTEHIVLSAWKAYQYATPSG